MEQTTRIFGNGLGNYLYDFSLHFSGASIETDNYYYTDDFLLLKSLDNKRSILEDNNGGVGDTINMVMSKAMFQGHLTQRVLLKLMVQPGIKWIKYLLNAY